MHDELAQLSSGQGKRLALGMSAAAVVIVGALLWVGELDGKRGYSEAAHALEQLRQGDLRAFSSCAMPGISSSRLQSQAGTITALEQLGDHLGKAYGKTLDNCLPHLTAFNRALAALQVPSELGGSLSNVQATATKLEEGWTQYAALLNAPDKPYAHAVVLPKIERVAASWEAHRQAHRVLRDQLNEELF